MPTNQAPVVFGIFVVAQVLDACFTYGGVSRFGVQIEMNGLLAMAMHSVGPATALVVAKSIACLCGFVLYATSYHRMLAAATGACIGVAVVPWCLILFF